MATSEQITRMYQEELGRAPSASEIKFHQDAGSSRADIHASPEAAGYRRRVGIESGASSVDVVRSMFGTSMSSRHFTPEMWKEVENIESERGDSEKADAARRAWANSVVRRETGLEYGMGDERAHVSSNAFDQAQQNRVEALLSGAAPLEFTQEQEQSYQRGAASLHGGSLPGLLDRTFGTKEFTKVVEDVIPKELYGVADLFTAGMASPMAGADAMAQSEKMLGKEVTSALGVEREVAFTAADVALPGIGTLARAVDGLNRYGSGKMEFSDVVSTTAWSAATIGLNAGLSKLATMQESLGTLSTIAKVATDTDAGRGAVSALMGFSETLQRTGSLEDAAKTGAIRGITTALVPKVLTSSKVPAAGSATIGGMETSELGDLIDPWNSPRLQEEAGVGLQDALNRGELGSLEDAEKFMFPGETDILSPGSLPAVPDSPVAVGPLSGAPTTTIDPRAAASKSFTDTLLATKTPFDFQKTLVAGNLSGDISASELESFSKLMGGMAAPAADAGIEKLLKYGLYTSLAGVVAPLAMEFFTRGDEEAYMNKQFKLQEEQLRIQEESLNRQYEAMIESAEENEPSPSVAYGVSFTG